MRAPRRSRQYSKRPISSWSHVNVAAPASGPSIVLTPPRSTMMSASNERGMDISSGKTLPLENT